MRHILKFTAQAFILWLICSACTWMVAYFHIPLPGSVLGMVLLFILLSTGIIKEQWLTAATTPLLKHLTFFFIPIAVELMEWGDMFIQNGAMLIIPLIVSALVALLTTGGIIMISVKSKAPAE